MADIVIGRVTPAAATLPGPRVPAGPQTFTGNTQGSAVATPPAGLVQLVAALVAGHVFRYTPTMTNDTRKTLVTEAIKTWEELQRQYEAVSR